MDCQSSFVQCISFDIMQTKKWTTCNSVLKSLLFLSSFCQFNILITTPAAAEELPVEALRSPHSAAVVELTKTRCSVPHTVRAMPFSAEQLIR